MPAHKGCLSVLFRGFVHSISACTSWIAKIMDTNNIYIQQCTYPRLICIYNPSRFRAAAPYSILFVLWPTLVFSFVVSMKYVRTSLCIMDMLWNAANLPREGESRKHFPREIGIVYAHVHTCPRVADRSSVSSPSSGGSSNTRACGERSMPDGEEEVTMPPLKPKPPASTPTYLRARMTAC